MWGATETPGRDKGENPSAVRDEKAGGSERAGRGSQVTEQVGHWCWKGQEGQSIVLGIKWGHADKCLASTWRLRGLGEALETVAQDRYIWGPARPRVLGWPRSIPGQNLHWGLFVLGFYFSILKMVLSEISGQTFKGQNRIEKATLKCKKIGDKYTYMYMLTFAGSMWGVNRVEGTGMVVRPHW